MRNVIQISIKETKIGTGRKKEEENKRKRKKLKDVKILRVEIIRKKEILRGMCDVEKDIFSYIRRQDFGS